MTIVTPGKACNTVENLGAIWVAAEFGERAMLNGQVVALREASAFGRSDVYFLRSDLA